MAQDRSPLPTCIHMTKPKSGWIGDGLPELFGKIAQDHTVNVAIA